MKKIKKKNKDKMNNNWVAVRTPKFLKDEADKTLKKLKKQREGKKYVMVKVSDRPLTYKEVEVDS